MTPEQQAAFLAVETFKVSADGKSITCLRCQRTSHHPQDVKQHYCGFCHVFHDDLWPPARGDWIRNAMLGTDVIEQ